MSKRLSIIIGTVVVLCAIGLIAFVMLPGDSTPTPAVGEESYTVDENGAPLDESSFSESSDPFTPKLLDTVRVVIRTSEYFDDTKYVSCTVDIYSKISDSSPAVSDKNCLIKVRGNSTSSGEKKPFNIKFSQKTDVLGMGANTRWSLLANCFDKTLIRNQTVYDFSSLIGLSYTPSYRVADVYLNGKLLGAYLLCDPIDVSEDRIDIDNEGNEFVIEFVHPNRNDKGTVYVTTGRYNLRFGIREPEEPTRAQRTFLQTFLRNAETALASNDYSQVQKYFDIDSMVNFYIVNELFKNIDIAIGSTFFYIDGDKLHGGPVWDFDLSAGNCSYDYFNYYEYNNINGEGNGSGNNWEGIYCNKLWFEALLAYPEFSSAVAARYKELQNGIVNLYEDNSLGESYIDRITEHYSSTFNRNFGTAGWSLVYPYSEYERQNPDSTYKENVEYFRDWLKKRNQWLLKEWNIT